MTSRERATILDGVLDETPVARCQRLAREWGESVAALSPKDQATIACNVNGAAVVAYAEVPIAPDAGPLGAARAYAALLDERERLERELTVCKAKLSEQEPAVKALFTDQGVDRLKVLGRTLYLRRELYAAKAKGVATAVAVGALRAAGLDDLVAEEFSASRLSAWCREVDAKLKPNERLEDALPASFRDVIRVAEVFKVGQRGSE